MKTRILIIAIALVAQSTTAHSEKFSPSVNPTMLKGLQHNFTLSARRAFKVQSQTPSKRARFVNSGENRFLVLSGKRRMIATDSRGKLYVGRGGSFKPAVTSQLLVDTAAAGKLGKLGMSLDKLVGPKHQDYRKLLTSPSSFFQHTLKPSISHLSLPAPRQQLKGAALNEWKVKATDRALSRRKPVDQTLSALGVQGFMSSVAWSTFKKPGNEMTLARIIGKEKYNDPWMGSVRDATRLVITREGKLVIHQGETYGVAEGPLGKQVKQVTTAEAQKIFGKKAIIDGAERALILPSAYIFNRY